MSIEKSILDANQKENHLRKGVSPIMTCIGPGEAHFQGTPKTFYHLIEEIDPDGDNYEVDFYSDDFTVAERQFKNAGRQTYVISGIDDKNKFSQQYHDCTGIVAIGKEKGTGKEISFLSHQAPYVLIDEPDLQHAFRDDLKDRLSELKDRCENGTVDIIVIGGKVLNYSLVVDFEPEDKLADYKECLQIIGDTVKDIFGFSPIPVGGPKLEYYTKADAVFLDNNHRRTYLLRERIDYKK